MNVFVKGSLLHEVGREALDKYLEFRPSTALFYDLYDSNDRMASASHIENYNVGNEAELRTRMRSMASDIRGQIAQDTGPDARVRLHALASQIEIFAGYTEAPYGYIDTWMGHIPFIINQINGPLIDIPEALANSFSITREADAFFYLQRLTALESMISSVVQKFEYDLKQGWYAPDAILSRAVAVLQAYIACPATLHPLYRALEHQLEQCKDVTAADRTAFLERARSLLESSIYPAFSGVIETVERFLSSDHVQVSSVLDLPEGVTYYRNALRYQADSFDGVALHQFGLEQLEACDQQLAQIATDSTSAETTESYLLRRSGQDLASFDFTQALLGYLTELNARASASVAGLVAGVQLEALSFKAIPRALEASAPFAKYTPAGRNTPAIFWVNAAKVSQLPFSFLEVVAFHETVPGHHLQFCAARQNQALPVLLQLSLFNTFIEGWATYAEGLASQLQLYTDATSGKHSRIGAERLRSARVVADTGIHAQGWTRAQGIAYLEKAAGLDAEDAAAEIDRYLAVPAQAAGYQVGLATIRRLRSDAVARSGDAFDLSRFNADFLRNGAVPLN